MDVFWYADEQPKGLSFAKEEPSDEDSAAARAKELEEAGFTSAARQLHAPSDLWAEIRRVAHPMTIAEWRVYLRWFGKRCDISDYVGPQPPDLAKRVIAIKATKHFADFKIWTAKSGEALLIGELQAEQGYVPQPCIIGHWNAKGGLTEFETMKRFERRRVIRTWTALGVVGATLVGFLITLLVMASDERHHETTQGSGSHTTTVLPFFVLIIALYMMSRSRKRRQQQLLLDTNYILSPINKAVTPLATDSDR